MKPAEWLTVRQAAVLVGRDVSRIYRWMDTWALDHRHGARGTVVRTSRLLEIEAFLSKNPNARPTRRT